MGGRGRYPETNFSIPGGVGIDSREGIPGGVGIPGEG